MTQAPASSAPDPRQITALVITFNEAANIKRTLDALTWLPRVLLVDSGSTDDTLLIAQNYRNVEIIHQPFESFASQCNFGISQVTTDWVLSLDADYELSPDLIEEIRTRTLGKATGYSAEFVYRIQGHTLRGTLYPPRVVLYRRDQARYRDEGHGHRVQINGLVAPLKGCIYHDDRKPLARWFSSQQKYASLEAQHLIALPKSERSLTDRIRLLGWPAPFLVFFYTLIVKGCLLDGWPGWLYALQRLAAETMIALEIIDRKLTRRSGS